jgi:predicted nucleic acid-binding protein
VIVYAETNFLLELAYLQERCESCGEILALCQASRISLIVPAFSISEARRVWDTRLSERNVFEQRLIRLIRELARSQPFKTVPESSKDLLAALTASGEDARDRLEQVISTIARFGSIQPLAGQDLAGAIVLEKKFSLSPSDAIVLASIMAHLGSAAPGPKCFVSQDAKGFANPGIHDELAGFECKVLVNFADAAGYVGNVLRTAGPGTGA